MKLLDHYPVEGEWFGWWTVLGYAGKNKHGTAMWDCICRCSRVQRVSQYNLLNGVSKSCGHCGRPRKKRRTK